MTDRLDFTDRALSDEAIALIGFQRTRQISRKSNRSRQLSGDSAPLLAEARARRHEIFSGALQEIHNEYIYLREYLGRTGRRPRSVIDIGCGQGINNLFLIRDFAPDITLVDIESTESQHHFWAETGSGYADLGAARALLLSNGAEAASVRTVNPRSDHGALEGRTADLVTSLYSCGFHYPVDEYAELFVATIEAGGAVVLDLRAPYRASASPVLEQVLGAGSVEVLYRERKSERVVIARATEARD